MAEDEDRGRPETAGQAGGRMSEREIDCNLIETFPASDPPSWTLGTDHRRESPPPAAGPPARNEGE